MTKKEFAQIGMAIRTYYPSANILPNDQSFDLWFHQLEDLPYDLVKLALEEWVSLNKWAPTIADLREKAAEIKNGPGKTWGEAWEEVLKVIRRFGTYRADEALEALDEVTCQVVKRIGYQNICQSENIAADRANFRMIYEQITERKKQEERIAPKMLEMIRGITSGMIGIKGDEEE